MQQRPRPRARGFSTAVVSLLRFGSTVLPFLGDVLITLIRALPLLLVAGIYLLLDYLGGVSLLPLAVLVAGLASLPCSLLLVGDRSRRARYAVPAVVLVLLLAVSPVDWHSRKPLFRAFYAIAPGMTIEQVDRHMALSLQSATAVMGPVKAWGYGYCRRPNVDTLRYRPWDCADIFVVHFVDGRVIERYFEPD